VYLEVFGLDASPVETRFTPTTERVAAGLNENVRLGISPHAPYTCSLDLYRACAELGLPLATHLAESEAETEFLQTGTGSWKAFAEMLVPPPGTTGLVLHEAAFSIRSLILPRAASRPTRKRSIACRAMCGGPLSALECDPRLASRRLRAPQSRDPRLHRNRQPGVSASFDMFDEMRAAISAARPGSAGRRADRLRRRSSSLRSVALVRSGSTQSSDRSPREEADLTVLSSPKRPSFRGKIRLRRLFSRLAATRRRYPCR
jgi:hypothetical protein